MLNDHTMYEHVLSDELWMGVVGMLECELLDILSRCAPTDIHL